ncbi:MAG TPA: class I SAM-dependent methyltransferase [Gemmatimonadales bacterium]|nr:class I SAM-dependent methyltransferase [Gemmatimonadales bacterium]
MSTLSTDDPLVARSRAVWTSGDFEHIARAYSADAAAFIDRLGLKAGERVLDVACGTGNLTVPAARTGASVTGIDIAPHLLAHACEHASEHGVTIRLDEGNAEDMPYPDAAFDTVVTMFGAMFAPRPELAAAEMRRVVRPGGRIAMANWMKDGFVGQMLRMHVARVPPPAGVPSVLLWGDEATVRERFAGARSVTCTRRPITFLFPTPPTGVVEIFRSYYGPTVRTFGALEPDAREAFARELETHYASANAATDGTTRIEADYLEVLVVT